MSTGSGTEVNYEGDFHQIRSVRLQPPSIQRPSPPIWIAGRRDGAMKRAARFGDYWMPYLYRPEQVASSLARIADLRSAAKVARPPIGCGLFTFITTYQNGSKAERIAPEHVGRNYQQDFTRFGRYLVAGTPAQCRSRLSEYAQAGVDVALLVVTAPKDDYDAMLELVAREIMPELRA